MRLKEEQLRREEEKVTFYVFRNKIRNCSLLLQIREIELRVQREINEKRQELMAKETALRLVSSVFVMPSPANNTATLETWRIGSQVKHLRSE